MGRILPTMHYYRSQHCLESLHPCAHHCQHGRNSCQHSKANNVGSCCVRLHVALKDECLSIHLLYLEGYLPLL